MAWGDKNDIEKSNSRMMVSESYMIIEVEHWMIVEWQAKKQWASGKLPDIELLCANE